MIQNQITEAEEKLFNRGFCPLCVIYDLRQKKHGKDAWQWCRCCGQAWRRLPDGSVIATQLTILIDPCKHRKRIQA